MVSMQAKYDLGAKRVEQKYARTRIRGTATVLNYFERRLAHDILTSGNMNTWPGQVPVTS